LAAFVPILFVIILVIIESSFAYNISRNMNIAAALAARGLAAQYELDSGLPSNTTEQQAVFSGIRITNMVNSNNQFTIPNGSAGWNTGATPPTVTVKVKYLSGQGSPALPSFPNPDPLGLGSAFVIQSTATYRLD
jgi:Flp pilus assembly protein TadG